MLKTRGAEMNIEYVKGGRPESDIGSQASSGFATVHRQIIVAVDVNRKSRQYEVAVTAAIQPPRLPKRGVESEFFSDESSLVRLATLALDAQYLLEGNDICVDFAQDIHDAARPNTTIQAAAFVNVVGDNSDRLAACAQLKEKQTPYELQAVWILTCLSGP